MLKPKIAKVLCGGLLIVGASWSGSARADFLINSGFESGDTTPWNVTTQAGSTGTFYTNATGTTSPVTGSPTAGPNSGLGYAVSDQAGPPGAAAALWVYFTVPGSGNVTLTFNLFVNDQSGSGGIVNSAGLDYTGGSGDAENVNPNQHAR